MPRLFAFIAVVALLAVPAQAYDIRVETAYTTDGVTLRFKRFANSGPPVILLHGIVQNQNCMDLNVPGSSLAKYLADRGYDVWVGNLRSHGTGVYKSSTPPNWDWSIDHFAAYDVPAMVNKVTQTRGQKPFWVGHSMGGMSVYGYLQGVEIKSVKIDEVWGWTWCGFWPCYKKLYDVYGERIVRNASLAAARNNALRGVVTVASPVKLKWVHYPSLWTWSLYNYWDYNLIVTKLADSNAANNALKSLDYVPIGTMTSYLTGDLRNIPYVGGLLSSFLQWVFGSVGSSILTAQVWYPDNMTPTIAQAVINTTIDNTESRVSLQFLDSVRARTWREFHVDDPMRSPYVYADHYSDITAKLCVIAGNRDKMANDNVLYWEGFKKMGSADKTWRDFNNFGHDDLVLGEQADNQVYPFIYNWLRVR